MLKPCEHISTLPSFKLRLDVAAIDVALHFVGQQNVDDVGLLGRFGRADRLEAVADGQIVVLAAGPLADDHVQPLSRRFWAWAWPCEP